MRSQKWMTQTKAYGREGGKSGTCQLAGWIILVEAGFTQNDEDVTMEEMY